MAKPEDIKRQALLMYMEGLGFHSIGRILRVSHVSVLNWIRKYGKEIEPIRNNNPVKIIESDKLHTYVQHKKLPMDLTCICRNDKDYIGFVIENRGAKTALKLWDKVGKLAQGEVMADYWKSYTEIVPGQQLVQTKAETYTIKSYNELIMGFLARFRRKSKCHSKSEEMIELTLKLFFLTKIQYYRYLIANSIYLNRTFIKF